MNKKLLNYSSKKIIFLVQIFLKSPFLRAKKSLSHFSQKEKIVHLFLLRIFLLSLRKKKLLLKLIGLNLKNHEYYLKKGGTKRFIRTFLIFCFMILIKKKLRR